jgi:hypothetical protein
MMEIEKQPAYEMFWKTEHIKSNEKFDARLVKFPGWENIVGWMLTIEYDLPDEIAFEADFSVTRQSDYPFNNVNWPLMSRRMLNVLLSVGDFRHRAIPVRLVDETVRLPRRKDAKGQFKKEVVDDRFVAVQLSSHLEAFDRERSEYEVDTLFPDEVGIIKKLVLREPGEGYPPLFRLAAKPNYLFVSAAAKQRLEMEKLHGMVFWTLDKIKV